MVHLNTQFYADEQISRIDSESESLMSCFTEEETSFDISRESLDTNMDIVSSGTSLEFAFVSDRFSVLTVGLPSHYHEFMQLKKFVSMISEEDNWELLLPVSETMFRLISQTSYKKNFYPVTKQNELQPSFLSGDEEPPTKQVHALVMCTGGANAHCMQVIEPVNVIHQNMDHIASIVGSDPPIEKGFDEVLLSDLSESSCFDDWIEWSGSESSYSTKSKALFCPQKSIWDALGGFKEASNFMFVAADSQLSKLKKSKADYLLILQLEQPLELKSRHTKVCFRSGDPLADHITPTCCEEYYESDSPSTIKKFQPQSAQKFRSCLKKIVKKGARSYELNNIKPSQEGIDTRLKYGTPNSGIGLSPIDTRTLTELLLELENFSSSRIKDYLQEIQQIMRSWWKMRCKISARLNRSSAFYLRFDLLKLDSFLDIVEFSSILLFQSELQLMSGQLGMIMRSLNRARLKLETVNSNNLIRESLSEIESIFVRGLEIEESYSEFLYSYNYDPSLQSEIDSLKRFERGFQVIKTLWQRDFPEVLAEAHHNLTIALQMAIGAVSELLDDVNLLQTRLADLKQKEFGSW